MASAIIVSAHGAAELKALTARLKAAKRVDLQKKLREKIKDAGNPVVEDIRRAARGMTVTRGLDTYARRWEGGTGGRYVLRDDLPQGRKRSTGLRERASRAVMVSQTRKGIRLKVSAKKFGDYGVTLPRRMDAELPRWRRWRHPVFGNREVWVEQVGSHWFLETIRKHRKDFRRSIFVAIEETKKELLG